MEFLVKAKTGNDINLSEAYNYWAGKKYALDTPYLREVYQNIDGLAGFLAVKAYQFGSASESDWAYEKNNWLQTKNPKCKVVNNNPGTECFTGIPPENMKLLPYKIEPIFIERTKISQFILTEKKPVVFNILWIPSVVNAKGDFTMPKPADLKNSGGHVILLVGFDGKTKKFIFRNSYGPNWGNKGYGTIPEDYIIKYCEVCSNLKSVSTYPQETQKFINDSAKGVSGNLL
jgi:hypothetical protein